MVLRKLIQKSRLDNYKKLISFALDQGYQIKPLCEPAGEKTLYLRHDIDKCIESAEKMYLLEKELGVKSSYYFRWCIMKPALMREMNKDGFEVSLHYETLDRYCRMKRIKHIKDLPLNTVKILTSHLKNEIELFQMLFDWEIKTITSHGGKRNKIIGVPNKVICKNSSLNKFDKSNYDIKDSSIKHNHKWQFGDPWKFIEQGISFTLLIHPVHWHYAFQKNIRILVKDFHDRYFY